MVRAVLELTRLLFVFLLSRRRLLVVGLGHLGLDLGRFSVEVLCSFDAFHEVDDFRDVVFHGVKPLAFHFLLPGLWSPVEDDIQDLVVRQALVGAKWRK